MFGVRAGVDRVPGRAFLLAEIDSARQLANDQEIDAGDHVGPQRGRVRESLVGDDRAQIGVNAQILAQREQSLFGPRRPFPFRPADRTEQHGVGLAAQGERVVGQRHAAGVDGAAAELCLAQLERMPEARADGGEDARRFRHHLRADAVSGQDCDQGLHRRASKAAISFSAASR